VSGRELIVVRSLTDSDLGLFAAHRAAAKSKQRAININSEIARQLLSADVYARQGTELECIYAFGKVRVSGRRYFGKVHKNWRLGGKKIEGDAFSKLDSKDFLLIRSRAGNDGSFPLFATLISKRVDRVVHAGIAAIVGAQLKDSMIVYSDGDAGFADLAKYCCIERKLSPRAPKSD
jgi:hypothetical protein